MQWVSLPCSQQEEANGMLCEAIQAMQVKIFLKISIISNLRQSIGYPSHLKSAKWKYALNYHAMGIISLLSVRAS